MRRIVTRVLSSGLPDGVCLNVNFPVQPIRGLRVCRQARGYWSEEYELRVGEKGREGYFLTGHFVNTEPEATDTDEYFWQTDMFRSYLVFATRRLMEK